MLSSLGPFWCPHRCGDEIVEINEAPVTCMTLNDVYAILSHCEPGPVPILVSRHPDPQVTPPPPRVGRLARPRLTRLALKSEESCWVSASILRRGPRLQQGSPTSSRHGGRWHRGQVALGGGRQMASGQVLQLADRPRARKPLPRPR